MTDTRKASCRCGQLTIRCSGDPARVSICHCYDCQRRSGSAFAYQARFRPDRVEITGEERVWETTSDSGNRADFHFCPVCGSTLYYRAESVPDLIAVAVGGFADNSFPQPQYSVYENRKHAWIDIVGQGIDHYD